MAKSEMLSPSKIAVWVILALLIVGLAGFGTTQFGGTVHTIGKVGSTDIPVTRYANALQQEIRRISEQTGQQISFSQAQEFGLDQSVLAQVIGRVALEDEARELGISVGDETVADEIRQVQAFQGLDGSFDREAYRFALQNAGLDAGEFEESIRSETARTILQSAVVSGLSAPDVFADTLYAYARETRDFHWVRIDGSAALDEVPEPTEEELRTHYADNESEFTLPERRHITYAWVTPEMLVDDVEIAEETLRNLYEDRIDEFVQPERRLVERLAFSTEAAAEDARAAIEAGETDFESLVEDRGLDLADIDLGDVSRDDLDEEAADAIFALEEPGIVGPAPSPLGPALFRVNAILTAREIPFEEAEDMLRGPAAMDAARRRIDDLREEANDLLAAGATLEELARETDMDLDELFWTDDLSEGIAGYPGFREAAASVEEGDFPELIELEDGGIFALRLDEIVDPTLQPFDEVEDDVRESWIEDQISQAARDRAATLLADLREGADPADLDLTVQLETGMTRDAFVEGAPDALVTEAFEMEPGEWRVIDADDGAVLIGLDSVEKAPENDESSELKQRVTQSAAQGYSRDLLEAFTRATQSRKGIELNQSALNAVHSQFQ